MLVVACLFVAGVAMLENEPLLPDAMWCASLPVCVLLIMARVRASPLFALAAGYFWAAFVAHVQMEAWDTTAVEGRDVEIAGTVRGLPVADARRVRFDVRIGDGSHAPLAGERVRLSWYGARAVPMPGSVWRLTVRLRRPRGWHNPGGSDYEGRLFARPDRRHRLRQGRSAHRLRRPWSRSLAWMRFAPIWPGRFVPRSTATPAKAWSALSPSAIGAAYRSTSGGPCG